MASVTPRNLAITMASSFGEIRLCGAKKLEAEQAFEGSCGDVSVWPRYIQDTSTARGAFRLSGAASCAEFKPVARVEFHEPEKRKAPGA